MSRRMKRRRADAAPGWHALALAFGVLLLLLAPLAMRSLSGAPVMPGPESYDALRRAQALAGGTASLDGVAFTPTPHDALLLLALPFGADWLLPAIVGVAVAMLLRALLRRRLEPRLALIATVAVAISPAMIVAGSRHNAPLLALAFLVAATLARHRPILMAVLLWLGVVTSPALGLLISFILLARASRSQDQQAVIAAIGALIGAGVWTALWGGGFSGSSIISPASLPLFELGSGVGLSAFFLIVAAYGVVSSSVPWRDGGVLCAAIVGLMLVPAATLPASVIVAIIAARGLCALFDGKWALAPLRQLLLVLIACAAAFVVITALRTITHEQPTERLVDVLEYIGDQRRAGDVLTAPELAPIVEYYSGRQATLDKDSSREEIEAAFLTRDSDAVYGVLERSDTSFILITDGMRQGVFSRSDEGLLFLLPNTERFVPMTSDRELTLWYYISRQPRPLFIDRDE